jgi:hypothetical protein
LIQSALEACNNKKLVIITIISLSLSAVTTQLSPVLRRWASIPENEKRKARERSADRSIDHLMDLPGIASVIRVANQLQLPNQRHPRSLYGV